MSISDPSVGHPIGAVDAGAGRHRSPARGTVAGFRTPRFEAAISVAGYHLHYVDDDRARGGHVLDLVLAAGHVSICPMSELRLVLSDTPESLHADLRLDDLAKQEQQAEGSSA